MLNAGDENFDTLKAHAETVDLDGIPVRTLSLEGLLRTKERSSRSKDIGDRDYLEEALRRLKHESGKK